MTMIETRPVCVCGHFDSRHTRVTGIPPHQTNWGGCRYGWIVGFGSTHDGPLLHPAAGGECRCSRFRRDTWWRRLLCR